MDPFHLYVSLGGSRPLLAAASGISESYLRDLAADPARVPSLSKGLALQRASEGLIPVEVWAARKRYFLAKNRKAA